MYNIRFYSAICFLLKNVIAVILHSVVVTYMYVHVWFQTTMNPVHKTADGGVDFFKKFPQSFMQIGWI